MKQTAALVSLAVLLFLPGCKTVVNLAINNPTPDDLDVSVTQLDNHNLTQGQTNVGPVSKSGGTASTSFTVPKNGGYQVTATLQSAATVFNQPYSVAGRSSPVTAKVSLSEEYKRVPEDGQELAGLFDQLGDAKGFPAADLGNTLSSVLGGIIIYSPPVSPATEPNVHYSLGPAQLGNKPMDLNGFPFGPLDSSSDSDVERSASATLAGQVPMFGKLDAQFSAGTLYKVHAELKGFGGTITKPDAADWNLDDALAKLSDAQKSDICTALGKDQARMMYVNKLYPLKAANFTYQEGTKVTSSAQADGSTLISASGAFSFSTSTAKTYEIGASALNLSGVYFDKNQVPCDAWSGAKGVVAPPAPAAPPPMPDAGKKQPALIIQRQQIQIQQMLQQMQNQQQVMASKLGVSTKHDVIPASVINHLPAK